jgi:hypothetical protein
MGPMNLENKFKQFDECVAYVRGIKRIRAFSSLINIVTCIARQQTDKHLVICARNNRTNVYVTGCLEMTQ